MAETTGPIRAFLAAGRPIPAWAGQDLNELSCLWQDNHAANPTFKLATASAHTWLVRLALRKGLAAANGMDNDEPSLIDLPFSEDSTSSDPSSGSNATRACRRQQFPRRWSPARR